MNGSCVMPAADFYTQTCQLRKLLARWVNSEADWFGRLSEDEFVQGVVRASHLKRLEERWTADPHFKTQAAICLDQALTDYGLTLDFVDRQNLIPPSANCPDTGDQSPTAADFRVLLHRRWFQVNQTVNDLTQPQFKAWRERQMARCDGQLKKYNAEGLIHAPIAFELSQGCSVGCWFCAVSAGRLKDVFRYTEDNAHLWCSVLEVIKEVIGPAAGTGLCYWATDPLDNPDYEKLCCDFHSILGMFPQTTTAQPLKDPTRTRALLQLSLDKMSPLNRFSILSLKMLDRLHAEFSAEELALVDLVLQNKEGTGVVKFEAGRVRDRLKLDKVPTNRLTSGTSACVSGFLINMIERRVKLISPCPASDDWPHGYMIFSEDVFTDVLQLKQVLERMIAEHMPLTLHDDDRLCFRSDLTVASLPEHDGVRLSSAYQSQTFKGDAALAQLCVMIVDGDKTASELRFVLEICGIPEVQTNRLLLWLFERGLLAIVRSPKQYDFAQKSLPD